MPEVRGNLEGAKVHFDDYLLIQKSPTGIAPETIGWKMLDNLGLSKVFLNK